MVGGYISKVIVACQKRKVLFYSSLSIVILLLIFGLNRLKINENIFSTFPKGESFEPLNALLEAKNLSNNVIFSLNKENIEEEELENLVQSFSDSLKIISKNYLTDIESIRSDIDAITYDYFYTNFPLLIDSNYYKYIDSKLQRDSIIASLNTSFEQLIAPGAAFTKRYILNDPLYISTPFFQKINTDFSNDQFVVKDGFLFSYDKKSVLITSKTAFPVSDSRTNESLDKILTAFKVSWNSEHPENAVDYFGTFEIAAKNASRIKKDTMITASIALFAILVILFFYYRKLLIPLLFILPALFAGLFSLGIMGFVKPEISAISVATAAIILGIVLDYSFHFFTHLRHSTSVISTIKEISAPLITGSFTTIMAFLALLFANSAVLRDFGLIAALSLFGAASFTLIAMPVILNSISFDYKGMPKPFPIKLPSISNKVKIAFFFAIIGITIGFLFSPYKPQFDGDLKNLSFHPESLKLKEQKLMGIHPVNEKRIFLFASDEDDEKARIANFKLFEKLSALKKRGKIENFQSSAQFQIPQKIKVERNQLWVNYWNDKEAPTLKILDNNADSIGFTSSAFGNFESWISNKNIESNTQTDTIIKALGIDDLIDKNADQYTYISSLQCESDQVSGVIAELSRLEGIKIFDRSEAAASLLELVKNDFNYILLITALIVFLTLLLIYGRIELALLAFLPMLISWIWIIGITGLLGIKFNFVNVVIATFIFGIGDDFSIFTLDGLLGKYKYGRNTLKSYQSAIILSALTTIIGTGVLIFAKHPAIHSIALISVIGLLCILFISLVFQPILFDLFIQRRVDLKRAPASFTSFLMSVWGFSYFVIGCFILQFLLLILMILPINKLTKARWLNSLLSTLAGSVINTGFHFTKNYYGMANLDLKKPSIIIANHASFLDILLLLMLSPKVIMLVKDWVYKSPLFGPLVRYVGFIPSERSAENLDMIKQRIDEGYSIAIFPEGTRSEDGVLRRFHKGAFFLAQELNLAITPILISGANDVAPKKEFHINRAKIDVKVLPRIEPNDQSWGTTYQERTKAISKYYKKEFKVFQSDIQNASYLFRRIFNNYIYKGPILEWYLRIKWKFESRNYDYYDKLIGDRKNILDLGCGYGYFSLFLHYRDSSRNILGVDYDEEKIEIAQNCYGKDEHLKFEQGNIKDIKIQGQDVVFLNDVLHYLSKENQLKVLNNVVNGLNENGYIFIRDGITDLEDRHEVTKKSEWFSTKLLGFNKREEDFCFLSTNFIKSFAEKNNLIYTFKEQSSKTSNVLFVLKKK